MNDNCRSGRGHIRDGEMLGNRNPGAVVATIGIAEADDQPLSVGLSAGHVSFARP